MRLSKRQIVAEAVERRRWSEGKELEAFFREIRSQHPAENITFLCIGTDCSSGDALGPLVGSKLAEYGFPHVTGTLEHPCDSMNFDNRLRQIPEKHIVVAVDACLGTPPSVGRYILGARPLTPAQSVGGNLPPVGDYSIAGIVNVRGLKPYTSLQMSSLYRVMGMADEIARAAAESFGMRVQT